MSVRWFLVDSSMPLLRYFAFMVAMSGTCPISDSEALLRFFCFVFFSGAMYSIALILVRPK